MTDPCVGYLFPTRQPLRVHTGHATGRPGAPIHGHAALSISASVPASADVVSATAAAPSAHALTGFQFSKVTNCRCNGRVIIAPSRIASLSRTEHLRPRLTVALEKLQRQPRILPLDPLRLPAHLRMQIHVTAPAETNYVRRIARVAALSAPFQLVPIRQHEFVVGLQHQHAPTRRPRAAAITATIRIFSYFGSSHGDYLSAEPSLPNDNYRARNSHRCRFDPM